MAKELIAMLLAHSIFPYVPAAHESRTDSVLSYPLNLLHFLIA